MLQLSADGLKNHIFAGNFRNAADSSADARAYDSRRRGGMLVLWRPLTADRAMCRLQASYVGQDPICESPHAARMPRRIAGVLNAFDLPQKKRQFGRVRNGSDALLRDQKTGNKKRCSSKRPRRGCRFLFRQFLHLRLRYQDINQDFG